MARVVPDATCEVEDADPPGAARCAGRSLLSTGLPLAIEDVDRSRLVLYRRASG